VCLRAAYAKVPTYDGFADKGKYIKYELRYNISLSIEEKAPTFLTIENYVDMEELLWLNDYHNYVHEGSRVDCSALLKMHCYTSARLQEICKAKYKVRYQAERGDETTFSVLTMFNRTFFVWLHGKTESRTLR
jgi:hypothetical protein